MTDHAALFADLAAVALELDVRDLRRQISEGRDDGLRAARYDRSGGRSAEQASAPERWVMEPRRDRTDADLALLASLERSYVTAIAEIAVRSRSGRPCEDWDEAVHDHRLLAEMDAVGVLERIPGEKPAKWVLRAGDALHDLEALARRHATRTPTQDEQHWHEGSNVNDVCAWHLAIHQRHRRPRRPGTNICDTCAALVTAGEGARPPAWLLEAEIDREAKPKAWTAALSRWLDELGVRRDRSA